MFIVGAQIGSAGDKCSLFSCGSVRMLQGIAGTSKGLKQNLERYSHT